MEKHRTYGDAVAHSHGLTARRPWITRSLPKVQTRIHQDHLVVRSISA